MTEILNGIDDLLERGRINHEHAGFLEEAKIKGQRYYFNGAPEMVDRASPSTLNRLLHSPEVLAYLDHARSDGFLDRITQAFEAADKLKIAFVGETIIDEYRYVQGLGKASKEFMLATVEVGSESFAGGVAAAALHGEWAQAECISPAKTIRKTRFVDADFNRKLFDVYSAKKLDLAEYGRTQFRSDLRTAVETSDVVIINDFGHGLFGGVERSMLSEAKFLAVNAQTNAGNFGFNPVTKYTKADFVCVDDPEARLATGMDDAPIEEVIREGLMRKMDCPRVLVTHGRYGSAYREGKTSGSAPAFAISGIDTMGAGDAVMAVTAPLLAAGLDLPAAALVGNVAGAIKVSIVGHRRAVSRAEITQTIEALLA